MQLRTLLTLVNFATIAVAILVLIAYPGLAPDAFYILLGWMLISLALIYSPWAARPIGGAPPPTGGGGSGAPLSSGPHASSLGFCMYCAAPIEPGTARCPSCGRVLPTFA